jgi:hypothetical protein
MIIIPGIFKETPKLLFGLVKIWLKNYITIISYSMIVGIISIATVYYYNICVTTYVEESINKGTIPEAVHDKLLLFGDISIHLLIFPLWLLASYFPLYQLNVKQELDKPYKTDSFTLLITNTSQALISLSSGWAYTLVKALNKFFVFLIYLCLCAFLSSKYENQYLEIALIIIASIWVTLLLLKISTLLVMPWSYMVTKNLNNSARRASNHAAIKITLEDGIPWAILITILSASMMLILGELLIGQTTNKSDWIVLIRQALRFYLPQPFLWFISAIFQHKNFPLHLLTNPTIKEKPKVDTP